LKYGSLFQEALDSGDVWAEEDGLMYEKTKTRSSKTQEIHKKGLDLSGEIKNKDGVLGIELGMRTQAMEWHKMDFLAKKAGSGTGSSSSSAPELANNDIMSRLQESFDATTRLRMSIKSTAQEISAVAQVTPQGMVMVQRGMQLCKELQGPTETIENMLCESRASITWTRAVEALQVAAKRFVELEKFHDELQALHKVYVPTKARSRRRRARRELHGVRHLHMTPRSVANTVCQTQIHVSNGCR